MKEGMGGDFSGSHIEFISGGPKSLFRCWNFGYMVRI